MTLNFTIERISSGVFIEFGLFCTEYNGYGITAKVTGGDECVDRVYIEVRRKDIYNDEKLKKAFLKEYNRMLANIEAQDHEALLHRLRVKHLLGRVIDP